MKTLCPLLAFLLLLLCNPIVAQPDCESHPLFNQMPEHKVERCEKNDFDEMRINQTGKNGTTELTKSGKYLNTTYTFTGPWENRPSMVQIFQNYSNAVTHAGGKVLYTSASQAFYFLKKSGDSFWIRVSGDGSGIYSVATIQEAALKQDILVTAAQIGNDINTEGKAVFYGIYFETGKSALKSESNAAIAEIAKYLKSNPGVQVYVVGHTDNTGTHDTNMKLSTDRAQAVVAELTMVHQIKKERLLAAGVGALSPVASNRSDEGKAKNRRVEIVVK